MNVLHIVDSISDSDGVSSHVLQLMKSVDKKKAKQFLLCGQIVTCDRFKAEGIEVVELPEFLHSARSIVNFTSAIKRLHSISKQLSADVIHSHSHYAANIAWYLSKLTGIRTVQTLHGIIPETGKLGHFKAHKFICVSEPGVDYLENVQNIPADKISLIRQGIELRNFRNVNRFSKQKVHVVSASRLEFEKGPDVFIKAAGLVNAVCDDVTFSLAGTGSMKNELISLNEKCGGNVKIVGEVKDIFSFLNDADIFVMSGRTKSEGFPMALAEAGLAGCLIISSRFDALKYIFDETKNGFTFELEDHEELAKQIINAVSNRSISVSMALEFQKKANELFDVKTFAAKHMKVYNG
jgi:glycosyltransferase involved in cell wall biosynthesis